MNKVDYKSTFANFPFSQQETESLRIMLQCRQAVRQL